MGALQATALQHSMDDDTYHNTWRADDYQPYIVEPDVDVQSAASTVPTHTADGDDEQHHTDAICADVRTLEPHPSLPHDPLTLAAFGHLDQLQHVLTPAPTVEQLLQHADVSNGYTLLHEAARNDRLQTVQWLLRNKMPPTVTSSITRETPLHLAAAAGDHCLPIVQLLVEHTPAEQRQIYLNQADLRGKTALHWASELEHDNVVRYLISAGADPMIKDNKGKVAMGWTRAFRSKG